MAQLSKPPSISATALNGERHVIAIRCLRPSSRAWLGEAGVASVKLPPRSPNLNAYAEPFVRTIKESCLERMILLHESGVRKATAEFMAHNHSERNHPGSANARICPEPEHWAAKPKCVGGERVGGLLNYYYRKAA